MKIINKLSCIAIKEDVEVHNTLNLKLFSEDQKLRPEVLEALNSIAQEFLEFLAEKDVKIKVKDIVLVGSNASYNYTKDSDIDLHIIADTSNFKDANNLYVKLYDAFKSLFNEKYPDLNIYNIPVEVYVETNSIINSNGIYSIKFNKWISEPRLENIPEFNEEEFNNAFFKWETQYKELISDIKNNSNINLTEASTPLTKEEKLRLFNVGKRRENLKAMGDTKLADYYYACGPQNLNLPEASAKLEAEIKKRGITVTWNQWPLKLDWRLKDGFIWAMSVLNKYSLANNLPLKTLQNAKDNSLAYFIEDALNNRDYKEPTDPEVKIIVSIFIFILVLKDNTLAAHQLINTYNIDKKLLKETLNAWSKSASLADFVADSITKNEFLNEAMESNLATLNDGNYSNKELIEKFSKNVHKIDKFINDLYKLRKDNIMDKGEYSIENLIFKEFRNRGYLDNLKQLKNKLKETELSLYE